MDYDGTDFVDVKEFAFKRDQMILKHCSNCFRERKKKVFEKKGIETCMQFCPILLREIAEKYLESAHL